jgi:hypothetical protein
MIVEIIQILLDIFNLWINKELIFSENIVKLENKNVLEMKKINDFFKPSVEKRLIEGHPKTDFTILKDLSVLEEYKKVEHNTSPGSLYTQSTYSNIKTVFDNLNTEDYNYIKSNAYNFRDKTLDDALTNVLINADPSDSSSYNDGFGGIDGAVGGKKK